MLFWNNIIQQAMLGTDKKQLSANELTTELAAVLNVINQNEQLDKEEKFLQLTAAAFNFRQCGAQALHKEGLSFPVAEKETVAYCKPAAILLLKDILSEDNDGLLQTWLEKAAAQQTIITPNLLPALFEKAVAKKSLRPLVAMVAGKRGAWLSRFKNEWAFSTDAGDEELWQTGTADQRKNILAKLRETDPATALTWLQQVWPQENAAAKTDFLKLMQVNISGADQEWLESLSAEKSQKVKEEALELLKKIPGSSISVLYQDLLRQSVALKKERGMLGLTSKTVVQVLLPETIDEAIFKSGIEKLSNQKEFTDNEFIVYQLMKNVPPGFWEQHFNCNPETVIGYFQKDDSKKKFIDALVLSIVNFNDRQWALSFMQHSSLFYLDILPLLPEQQQEYFSNKFFDSNQENIIHYAQQRKTEWGTDLAKNIFRHAAANNYKYNRSFFSNNIHLIPVQIVGELEKCTPADEYQRNVWSNTSEQIIKLITLKIQTVKAFQ